MFRALAISAFVLTALSVALMPAQAAAPEMKALSEKQTLTTETILSTAITEISAYPSVVTEMEVIIPPPPPPVSEVPVFTPPANLPPPEPGSAQEYAKNYLASLGLGESEFSCLVSLWQKESGWNYQAMNRSSGAYGIPQSLPGNKMASAGADWETNPETQIRWGVGYIQARYATPCGAYEHSQQVGWY